MQNNMRTVHVGMFHLFSFQRSGKALASLCIVANSTELQNSRIIKLLYCFSFQQSAKTQVSLCIVTSSTELQNSRNSILFLISAISQVSGESVHCHKLD